MSRAQTGTEQTEGKGQALLTAVERIVDSPKEIRAQVAQVLHEARKGLPRDATDEQIRATAEDRLIASYSNKTALAGGAAALPAVIPGVGSLATVLGGSLVDMTLCLKYEVEMVLALAAARGYTIEDPRERQLAYLLAAAHTYEASSGKNPLADVLKVEADAIWNFSPRQLGKIVATLFVKLALLQVGKGLARAVPLVGILVSSATNKTLTRRVGKAVVVALDKRGAAAGRAPSKKARRPAQAAKPAARKTTARKPAARAVRAKAKSKARS